eukprot:jgi/Psemu1/299889/fgenesh1_kg.3_\
MGSSLIRIRKPSPTKTTQQHPPSIGHTCTDRQSPISESGREEKDNFKSKRGDCRNRTGDLVHAKHTRYQLRQTPLDTSLERSRVLALTKN